MLTWTLETLLLFGREKLLFFSAILFNFCHKPWCFCFPLLFLFTILVPSDSWRPLWYFSLTFFILLLCCFHFQCLSTFFLNLRWYINFVDHLLGFLVSFFLLSFLVCSSLSTSHIYILYIITCLWCITLFLTTKAIIFGWPLAFLKVFLCWGSWVKKVLSILSSFVVSLPPPSLSIVVTLVVSYSAIKISHLY